METIKKYMKTALGVAFVLGSAAYAGAPYAIKYIEMFL